MWTLLQIPDPSSLTQLMLKYGVESGLIVVIAVLLALVWKLYSKSTELFDETRKSLLNTKDEIAKIYQEHTEKYSTIAIQDAQAMQNLTRAVNGLAQSSEKQVANLALLADSFNRFRDTVTTELIRALKENDSK